MDTINIISDFLKLVKDYCFSSFHEDNIEKYLKEQEMDIPKCITYILMSIYKERSRARMFDDNFSKIYNLENTIIKKSLNLIRNNDNIKLIINKINKLLEHKFEETYHIKYQLHYGCSEKPVVSYDKITEINVNNSLEIYENLRKLNEFNNLEINCLKPYNASENDFRPYTTCNDYLFCLCYYGKLF